jgi:tRNA-Thr(GGU) m(6)t(6)A37 methyltransferase TsaA
MQDEKNPRDPLSFAPIGIIHSPFTDVTGMPIQPSGARGIRGTAEIFEEYKEGLGDIEGFSRLILVYAFHRCQSLQLTVTPFLDTTPRGVFSTRAPCRPNPVGLSIVRLIEVNGTTLVIEDVDILDGTPLIDLKPYVPAFDSYPDASAGWLEHAAHSAEWTRSDKRFR